MFFLGGCTYTGIAALRWVGRQNKGGALHEPIVAFDACLADWGRWGSIPLGRKFLIATTGIINGNSMIDSIAGTAGATSKEVGL